MIDAPWYNDEISNTAFNIYASFTCRLDDVIEDFVKKANFGFDINSDDIQDAIFRRHGFNNMRDLTEQDIQYIKNEVEKRVS